MEGKEIINHLRNYINNERDKPTTKRTERLLATLESISDKDIFLGDEPSYFFARMKCNSTGVGNSYFNGSETRRTVAKDYVTDEYLFVDGHEGTAKAGLELFLLANGESIEYYNKKEIETVAKNYGWQLHIQDFRDLNMSMSSHRLNRYNVIVTKGPFQYPIRPIIAEVGKRGKDLVIGYTYKKNNKEYVLIKPETSVKDGKSGCAPWMFLGIIFPPILVIAFFVWLFKD